jgi:hypothetical protein
VLRARRPRRALVSDSPAGRLLGNLLAVMNATGDDAEDAYKAALKELRGDPEGVVVELVRAESASDPQDYPSRWALVHAAAELRHPATLPFLRNLALTPLPPEEIKDPHSFSIIEEETILRTTAVEAVGRLAVDGRREALDALFEILDQQPSLSIRRAAVQSILKSPRGRRLRGRVTESLPKEQQFLLDLKPTDVTDVPQIKRPERQLSESGRQAKVEGPPNLPGADPQVEERPRTRPPRRR